MADIPEILNTLYMSFPFIGILLIVIIAAVVFNILASIFRKRLLRTAKTKHQISNVEMFYDIIRYAFFFVLLIFIIFYYTGDLTALGITLGLFSAALGFALQKPITGIAAWLMVALRRPFEIGDRVIIGDVRGDVVDITLTHIYISEIGGIVAGEEVSGRVVMVPNSLLFEQNIVNYTSRDEYILDQVALTVTYESDLDKAVRVVTESVEKLTRDIIKVTNKKPYVRTFFSPSGVEVHVRYFAPVWRLQEFSSKITRDIFYRIRKARGVDIAYPHTEVLLRKKR